MKSIATIVSAVSMSVALVGGAAAQATQPLQPGETAMEFAQRIDACKGAEIVGAAFNDARTEVRVQCSQTAAAEGTTGAAGAVAGMSGGLGTLGTVTIGIAAAAGLAAALGGGGSSSTTTTN